MTKLIKPRDSRVSQTSTTPATLRAIRWMKISYHVRILNGKENSREWLWTRTRILRPLRQCHSLQTPWERRNEYFETISKTVTGQFGKKWLIAKRQPPSLFFHLEATNFGNQDEFFENSINCLCFEGVESERDPAGNVQSIGRWDLWSHPGIPSRKIGEKFFTKMRWIVREYRARVSRRVTRKPG